MTVASTPRTSELSGRAVIFLHAHPDDEAIFTAATMRRLADRGGRVILVTATGGELGEPLTALRPGERIQVRRRIELEAAAAHLGVHRLVLLGRRDSGMPGRPSARHPRALARGRTDRLAARIADLADAEGAEAIVHYDDAGIYRHPDHVAVHRIGSLAARLSGAAGYEATVDREYLRQAAAGDHLIDRASRTIGGYGRGTAQIPVTVRAGANELAAKHAAMAAHASQIATESLRDFDRCYRYEWYLRSGRRGIIDELTDDRPVPARVPARASAPR